MGGPPGYGRLRGKPYRLVAVVARASWSRRRGAWVSLHGTWAGPMELLDDVGQEEKEKVLGFDGREALVGTRGPTAYSFPSSCPARRASTWATSSTCAW